MDAAVKTLIVIQCRFGSTRLPGKALYPLCGLPVVVFLIRRLKAGLPDNRYRIVLATTTRPDDNPVAAWGKQEKIAVVRGETDNVLARYVRCVDAYPCTEIVRVTADNPLTCPELIQQAVARMRENRLEYVQVVGAPYGAGVDVFSIGVMERLRRADLEPGEQEHINKHIIDNRDRYRILDEPAAGSINRPDVRLTIDTLEDWIRVSGLFQEQDEKPWEIHLDQAVKRFDTIHL